MDKGLEFTWDSFNGIRTFKRTIVGVAVGGGFGYCYYSNQLRDVTKLPFTSDVM